MLLRTTGGLISASRKVDEAFFFDFLSELNVKRTVGMVGAEFLLLLGLAMLGNL